MADNSVIGALRVTLGLDSAQYEDGLKRASAHLDTFSTKTKTHATGIGAALDSVFDRTRIKLLDDGIARVGLFGSAIEKLGVAGIAAGVGVGAAALAFEGLNKNLEMADKLGKLAQQIGVPVEELSKLKYAAGLADVSLEQLGTGMTRLSKNMAAVAGGAKGPAAQAFTALQVSVKNSDGTLRASSDVMKDVATKFSTMQDGATKTALAVGIFGRSGADLIPLLNQGATGIAKFEAEAEKLGVVISEKTAKAAEAFEDNLKRLGVAFQGVGLQVTAQMAPAMETFVQNLTDATKSGSALHGVVDALALALKALASAGLIAGEVILEPLLYAQGLVNTAGHLAKGDFQGAANASKVANQNMAALDRTLGNTFNALWSGKGPAGGSSEPNTRTGTPPVLPKLSKGHTPTDRTAELDAQVTEKILQAKEADLTAWRALAQTDDEKAQAQLEINKADYEKKIAEIDKEIVAIKATKLDTHKQQQIADLEDLKSTLAITKVEKDLAIVAEQEKRRKADELNLQDARLAGVRNMLGIEADSLKSSTARADVELQMLDVDRQHLDVQQERLDADKTLTKTAREAAQKDLDNQKDLLAAQTALKKANLRLVDRVTEAADAVSGFKSALTSHNWAAVFDEFQRTIQTIQASFVANGAIGGFATAGGAVGSLVGGRIGGAIGLGAGVTSLAAGLPGLAATLLPGLASSGALMGGLTTLASFAGPIGIAVAAMSLLAPLLSGKPSNKGAGYDLITGAVSGNKRDSDTENAATSAGQAIKANEDALKSLGLTLGTTINGLVIGTRDLSQIYTSTGQTLTAAVGDSAAAVETAMKAVLSGATYASDAEKQLVTSMLAAGKGFADITTAIQTYAQAQQISSGLADQILRLVDPQAADQKAVRDAIDQQETAAKAMADQGYLTADQLAAITAQLSQLEGLQLDEVMKRYAVTVDQATASVSTLADTAAQAASMQVDLLNAEGKTAEATALKRAQDLAALDPALQGLQSHIWAAADAAQGMADATNAVATAASAVQQAFSTESQAAQTTADKYKGIASNLGQFLDSLTGSGSATGDLASLRAKFDATAAAAVGLDENALGALPQVGRDYLAAAQNQAKSALDFARDQARVRNAVEAAKLAAEQQVSVAQQQLDALKAMVSGIAGVNAGVLSLASALGDYATARAGLQAAQVTAAQAGVALNGANGKPVIDASLGIGVDALGNPMPAALQALGYDAATAQAMYQASRKAQGLAFATGGSFGVGGSSSSGDRTPVSFMANSGEMVNISHGDSMAALADAVSRQNGLLAEQNRMLRDNTADVAKTRKILAEVVSGSLSLSTVAGDA